MAPKKKKSNIKKRKSAKKRSGTSRGCLLFLVAIVMLAGLAWWSFRHFKEPVEAPKPKSTVMDSIYFAIDKLGIPQKLIKTKDMGDSIRVEIGLDPERHDLPFVNMLFSGTLEQAGATFVSGVTGPKERFHTLRYFDPIDEKTVVVYLHFARRKEFPEDKPLLSIIVDDFGNIHGEDLSQFCDLIDPNVTFAIMPGRPHAKDAMERGRAAGHELIIHMPMEPIAYPKADPGKNAIFVDMSPKEIRSTVRDYIKELPYCVGANNHMGSLATSDSDVMNVVLDELKKAGLYFIDSRTIANSVAYDVAKKLGIRTAKRNLSFLDKPDASMATMSQRAAELKKMKENGVKHVVTISHCYPSDRLKQLVHFIDEAKAAGFELVPVSRLLEEEYKEIL